jgi:DNA-binding transcriptional ArsR family regulator
MINGIVNDIDTALSALADPTRRRVVEMLGTGPERASVLAARADMSRAAMSRNLRTLERAGVVSVETPDTDARGRLYNLRPESLTALGAWLDQLEAFWADQLGAFKAHAEKPRRRQRRS